MTYRERLQLAVHGCQLEHLPTYPDHPARIARLERARGAASHDWETSLVLGGGNYLDQVWAPMLLGALDVVCQAERFVDAPADERLQQALRKAIANYIDDLDTAKRMQELERERAAR